jgi:cytochrome bd-type quinol oxidase subunit 2
MSPFTVLPVLAGGLWLVHSALGATGHRAYRYSRWILFGGLAVTSLVFFLGALHSSNSVPPEWKEDSLGGVFEFILALETMLVLLALALLEVIHVAVTHTIEDARTRAESKRSVPSNSL